MTRSRGFTLIELAVVLVIITILIGGLAVPLTAQIQARRISETKKALDEAREAILGYAMTHSCSCTYHAVGAAGDLLSSTCSAGACPAKNPSSTTTTLRRPYLPCPDTSGDGREDRNLSTNACIEQVVGSGLSHGRLPWVDLGVGQQDAWGNRLLYAVSLSFSNKTQGFSSGTSLANPLQVCSAGTCATPDIASNIVFLLVSHGPNGWGALNVSGTTLASPDGLDEKENLDADTIYVSRAPYQPVDNTEAEVEKAFDDLLIWMPLPQLVAKLCPTGSDCNP